MPRQPPSEILNREALAASAAAEGVDWAPLEMSMRSMLKVLFEKAGDTIGSWCVTEGIFKTRAFAIERARLPLCAGQTRVLCMDATLCSSSLGKVSLWRGLRLAHYYTPGLLISRLASHVAGASEQIVAQPRLLEVNFCGDWHTVMDMVPGDEERNASFANDAFAALVRLGYSVIACRCIAALRMMRCMAAV